MPTTIARLFGCCTQPDTLEHPSPTQNSSAPKVLPRHARVPVGHIDLSRDLMEAGVDLPHDKLFCARANTAEQREVMAFLGYCRPGTVPRALAIDLIDTGRNRAAFLGALHLMRAGVIDPTIPDIAQWPGENWLNHIARHGREAPPHGTHGTHGETISLAQRIDCLLAVGLGGYTRAIGGHTAIFSAAQADNLEALSAIANREQASGALRPVQPLHAAAQAGKLAALRTALRRGADPDQADADGATTLQFASANSHLEAMRLLLDHGASCNRQDMMQQAPAHLAAQFNRTGAIRLLNQYGADLNLRGSLDDTPLHFAVYHNSSEAMKALVDCGANTRLRNREDETPLEMAVRLGRDAMANWLAANEHTDTGRVAAASR